MANTKAAKKANRQNEVRKAKNKAQISRIKTERKKFEKASIAKSEDSFKALSTCQSLLAKAAKKGVIHWKKAARLVSRMASKIAKSK